MHLDAKLDRRDGNNGPGIKVGTPNSGFYGPKSFGFFDSLSLISSIATMPHSCVSSGLYGLYHEPQKTDENSYGIGL